MSNVNNNFKSLISRSINVHLSDTEPHNKSKYLQVRRKKWTQFNCKFQNCNGIDIRKRLASVISFQKRKPVTYYSYTDHIQGLFYNKHSVLKKIQLLGEKWAFSEGLEIQSNG